MNRFAFLICWFAIATLSVSAAAQSTQTPLPGANENMPLQPFASEVRQLESALEYLGQPLGADEREQLDRAAADTSEPEAIVRMEQILDRHVLTVVDINAESRVQVRPGSAKPELIEGGTRLFLVKVLNAAGVTARLTVESPNSGPVYIQSDLSAEPAMQLTPSEAKDRWADITLFDKNPLSERLSGLRLEYRILQVYSSVRGTRSAKLAFSVGQGTQDIGFRNELMVVFQTLPSHKITLHVRDENGAPTTAGFTISDALHRIYPSPSKRLAPDLFFQPQIYRSDGESITLPAGTYSVRCSMGPEYHSETKKLVVSKDDSARDVSFQLERWINPAQYGWYSGDHHVHAAGCSHYQNPAEGVLPEHMARQVRGEKLNVGSVLTWGPCYYFQKQFFSGKDDPASRGNQLVHYDLEVSGFPSSHAGHLVLLGLKEQDYPNTKRIEDWPTWDLPILEWAHRQNAVTGFAHSGWGLEVPTKDLPNYEMPGFDGVGANEYIVDVTFPHAVDFISAADTPYVWEMNIWYHTLNVGFQTRISGETDFPCITDSRVGQGRVYAKTDGPLTYQAWTEALRRGRSYVSDGRSHLMDFTVGDVEVGTKASELRIPKAGTVHVTVKAAAYLSARPSDGKASAWEDDPPNWLAQNSHAGGNGSDPMLGHPRGATDERPYNEKPFWHVERARIGASRNVNVELVANGQVIARSQMLADGHVHPVSFDVPVERSSWLAVRILASSHTNPVFVIVGGKPIRASRASAEWCLRAVNQCWTQKARKISPKELPAAQTAYDHARETYRQLKAESEQ